MMKKITCIFNSPTINTSAISMKIIDTIKSENLNLKIKLINPLEADKDDVIETNGIIIGTSENLGSMAGATKDFFDRIYYEVIDKTDGLPIAVWIRAGHDGTGTSRQLKSILTGLKWKLVQEVLICRGPWNEKFIEECVEMSLGFAHGIEQNIF